MQAYDTNNVLRIAASNWADNSEPYAFPCAVHNFTRRPDCPKPGIQYDVLMFVLRQLNVTYTIVEKDEQALKSCNDDVRVFYFASPALIQRLKIFGLCALDTGIADFVVDLLIPNNTRVRKYDYTDVRASRFALKALEHFR